jgi:cytochrome c oxidase subunit 2
VRETLRWVMLGLGLLALPGCGSSQSTFDSQSHASNRIEHLWWVMFAGSCIVFAVVTMLVLVAVLRRRGAQSRPDMGPESRAARGLVLFGGALIPLGVLVALFVVILQTLPATSPASGSAALTIDVTGRQWFWDVRYPQQRIVTANELHIPVGQPVQLRVRTADVIHSFWVPALNRKIDMIPGHTNTVTLKADRAGTYRGQCAEFCGLQHANMAFYVVADPPARFQAWLARESRPRAPSRQRRGEQVFMSLGCGGCHTIAGTAAKGTVGPDLTHLASRLTIAAGTLPNRRGFLGGWILDPQHIKPGNKMPGLDISGRQLQPLLDYLASLK